MQPEKDLSPGDIIILHLPCGTEYPWDSIKCVVMETDDKGILVEHLDGDREFFSWQELTRINQATGTEHSHADGSPRVLPQEEGRRAGEAW